MRKKKGFIYFHAVGGEKPNFVLFHRIIAVALSTSLLLSFIYFFLSYMIAVMFFFFSFFLLIFQICHILRIFTFIS